MSQQVGAWSAHVPALFLIEASLACWENFVFCHVLEES